MHGQGDYNSQLDQSQAPLQHPYQQHVPGSFPPRTPVQPQVVPRSAVNQAPATYSHASHSAPPLYGHHMSTPPTAHHVLPRQAPPCALSSTIPTSQSFVNPLQRPLVPGSVPMLSTHLNPQQSSHHPSYAGNPMIHQILTSVARPPWADLSPSVPPSRLPPPPPIQGQTTYGLPVTSQAKLLGAAKSVMHSGPSSSGSLVHTTSCETHVSYNSSPTRLSSQPPLPLPSVPPVPLSSSSVLHNSSKLQQQCESEEKTKKSHCFGVMRMESTNDILNPDQMRSDASVVHENKTNDDGNDWNVSSVAGSGSTVDGNVAQDDLAAPPKPTEEKVTQKIEILCQFIAKNGPGFEDMARNRESRNPEFKFLFGGEPGSETAIAHDYFQWLKKKYCSTGRLPEGVNRAPSQHSEICSPRQPERLTPAAISDACTDSDMEMEDDITQLNEDEETSKSVPDLSCGPEFVQVKMDSKGQSDVVLDTVDDAAPGNVLTNKVSSPGSATFSDEGKGGITGKLTAVENDGLSSSTVHEHIKFGRNSSEDPKSPSRHLAEKYPSDSSLENFEEASRCPAKHMQMNTWSDAEDPINIYKNIDVDIRPEIPDKVEKAAGQLFESTRMDRASVSSSQFGTELKETGTASSIQELINEYVDESHIRGSVQAVPSGETFDQGHFRSATEYNNESSQPLKENKDHNFRSSPTAVKVDEFGRLVREGVSDSDSDDSYHASEHNKRGRNRGRDLSPGSRRRRRGGECYRRERRSISRSWSPRRRRSRSRSPRKQRSRSRSPRRWRSKSKSPRRQKSRSRSPRRRGSRSRSPFRFRGDSIRKVRGRKPECFDFLRGRCYRGSSCRYSHHDAEIDGSRRKWREPWNTEMESGLGHSDLVRETYDKSVGTSSWVDNQVKKQGSQHYLSMRNGSFDAMEVQKVGERNDLDNVDSDEQGAADQSQQGTVQDEVKDLSTGIPYTTNFKKVGIHGSLGDADAVMIRGKTFDTHCPTKSSLVPFQVDVNAAVSANPLPHPMDSAFGLKQSRDKNLTSSPVTSSIGTNAWNFPRGLNVDLGEPYLQPAPKEGFPSAKLSNIQPHLYSAPPSCTLNSMPASDMSGGTSTHGVRSNATNVGYMHYQHSHVPQNTNFDPQAFLKSYPSLMHSEVQRLGISAGEHFVGPNLTREALSSSDMNHFSTDNMLPAELSRPPNVHSYMHLQNKGDTSDLDVPKKRTTAHAQDLQGTYQTSSAPDYVGSGVTSHYNPHAATFEQPLMSRFRADILPQDYSGQYNTPQGVHDGGSEQSSSTKSAAGVQQTVAQPGGDQYDPLFDSIEPSIKKVNAQKQGSIYSSDVMLSMSSSNKPLDVEENNKKIGIEAIIPSTSLDDDVFGETADAEVGDVENASPSNPIDETNDMVGEVEIDQVKSPGKSKKRKESRSMKRFKIALANFVKEVLRPSWRQGNMSKEAFKTIVKKTVDKVTGAMKSHHIPNSQSKINHYIDSSQRKLTKLVMGYVDKYVKV